MSLTVILLIVLSCVLHAGWNLQAKHWGTSPALFFRATVLVTLAAAPIALLTGANAVRNAPPALWLCLLITGLCMAGYYLCLAQAYRRGDISLVYPLARSSPLFVVPLSGLIQNKWPTALAFSGILIVVAGCFLLTRKSLSLRTEGLSLRAYAGPGSLWALLTALCSSGYTVTDAIGMAHMKAVLPGMRGALAYGVLEGLSTAVWMALPVLIGTGGRDVVRAERREWGRALVLGCAIFVTYMLILWAYSLTSKVAYVAGLRQLSIVLGVMGGIRFLKEPRSVPRLAGSLVIVGGLVLIVMAR